MGLFPVMTSNDIAKKKYNILNIQAFDRFIRTQTVEMLFDENLKKNVKNFCSLKNR